jgi:hypothetical protein
VCRIAKNEKEVRNTLDDIWDKPEKTCEIIAKVIGKNKDVYEFEKMLEEE